MIKVIHTVCGGIAFYFREKLSIGDVIEAENVVLPDGSQPKPGSEIVCGNCGLKVYTLRGLTTDIIQVEGE